MARNALGRGLGALIREEGESPLPAMQAGVSAGRRAGTDTASAAGTGGTLQIDIDLIDPSPYQPRTRFAEDALNELAQSIRTSGIIQPLVVRKAGPRFQLIAGERRWRAAQRAQLARVPAILKEVSDEQALELTLVENIQREDLNPVEQARAFERLMEEFHLTQEEVATRTGKSRENVANSVRLLALDKMHLNLIEEGKMTAGHGRALLGVNDLKLRQDLALKAARGKLTVRQLERQASRKIRAQYQAALDAASPPVQEPNRKWAIRELEKQLGTQVWLHWPEGKSPGQLILYWYDEGQLQGFWDKLMSE